MRVLILSANTGGGHNSAALALRECFQKHGASCEIRDALSFVSDRFSETISKGHLYLYRHLPRLFGAGYRYAEHHRIRFVYGWMACGSHRFASYVNSQRYDAVVCTHLFGSLLVTEAIKSAHLSILHYLVVTDYALYPGTELLDVHRLFIGSESMVQEYSDAGIDRNRLVVSGIPIGSSYFLDKSDRLVRRRLQVSDHEQLLLLLGGSIGCGRYKRMIPALLQEVPSTTHLLLVCGNNQRLFKRMQSYASERFHIVGYTDELANFMAAADLCISKPGGLSTTELTVVGLPMVLLLSVPGCETHNLDYFLRQKTAVGAKNWSEAVLHCSRLLMDTDELASMRQRLIKQNYPGGAEVVVRTVMMDYTTI